jgi:protein-tyrosine phosphatase
MNFKYYAWSIYNNMNISFKMLTDQYYVMISKIFKTNIVVRKDAQQGSLERIKCFFSYPTQVNENLYLGNIYNSADIETLKSNKITMIVNVSKTISNYFTNDFKYINIKIDDINDERFGEELMETVDNIKEEINKNGNVFVHCLMGSSRSVTVVLTYLIKYENKTLDEAYTYLKNIRPTININKTFYEQLKKINFK